MSYTLHGESSMGLAFQTVSITIPRATATAAVMSSMILDPGPQLISSTKGAHALDPSKGEGNPWVRARRC